MTELIDLALKLWPVLERILALRKMDPAISPDEIRAELIKEADALSQKIDDDLKAHPI